MMSHYTLDDHAARRGRRRSSIQGVGFACLFVPLTTVALAHIPRHQLADATGLNSLLRQIGGSIGLAVFATLLPRFTAAARGGAGGAPRRGPARGDAARWRRSRRGLMRARLRRRPTRRRPPARVLGGVVAQQAMVLAFEKLFLLAGICFLFVHAARCFFLKAPPSASARRVRRIDVHDGDVNIMETAVEARRSRASANAARRRRRGAPPPTPTAPAPPQRAAARSSSSASSRSWCWSASAATRCSTAGRGGAPTTRRSRPTWCRSARAWRARCCRCAVQREPAREEGRSARRDRRRRLRGAREAGRGRAGDRRGAGRRRRRAGAGRRGDLEGRAVERARRAAPARRSACSAPTRRSRGAAPALARAEADAAQGRASISRAPRSCAQANAVPAGAARQRAGRARRRAQARAGAGRRAARRWPRRRSAARQARVGEARGPLEPERADRRADRRRARQRRARARARQSAPRRRSSSRKLQLSLHEDRRARRRHRLEARGARGPARRRRAAGRSSSCRRRPTWSRTSRRRRSARCSPGQTRRRSRSTPSRARSSRARSRASRAAPARSFSLLPADNASGNFVKVVQRVPVRIAWVTRRPDVVAARRAVGRRDRRRRASRRVRRSPCPRTNRRSHRDPGRRLSGLRLPARRRRPVAGGPRLHGRHRHPPGAVRDGRADRGRRLLGAAARSLLPRRAVRGPGPEAAVLRPGDSPGVGREVQRRPRPSPTSCATPARSSLTCRAQPTCGQPARSARPATAWAAALALGGRDIPRPRRRRGLVPRRQPGDRRARQPAPARAADGGAKIYVAGAVEDPSFPDDMKRRLDDGAHRRRRRPPVETYAGLRHGWVPSDTPVHDPAGAERHSQTLAACSTRPSAPAPADRARSAARQLPSASGRTTISAAGRALPAKA